MAIHQRVIVHQIIGLAFVIQLDDDLWIKIMHFNENLICIETLQTICLENF